MNNEGGPAFPSAPYSAQGMTLRDYFAGQAMAAFLSSKSWREDMDSGATARCAYRQADAMIATRTVEGL